MRILISLSILCFVQFPIHAKQFMDFSAISENNHVRNVCAEKLTTAFNQIGFKLKLSIMPAARSLQMSNSGETDGEIARIKGIESKYSNLLLIDVPCYAHHVHFYVKSGSEFIVDGWGSMPKEYLLGYRRGIRFIEVAAQHYKLSVYPLDSLYQSVGLLLADKVDVIVGSSHLFDVLSIEDKSIDNILRLEPSVEWHKFYSYIHKKHRHLLPKLTDALIAIKGDEEYKISQDN